MVSDGLSVIGSSVCPLLGSLRTNLSIILIKMKVKWEITLYSIENMMRLPLIYLVDPASCSGRLDRPLVMWGASHPYFG